MILTTHAIVGAAIASLNPSRPVSGFIAGFVVHFILDAIPHWEYKIESGSLDPDIGSPLVLDRAFFRDVFRIGSDLLLGIIFSLILFSSSGSLFAVLAGALGGIAPDALQFACLRLRWRPLIALQNFHYWIHATYKLKKKPVLGIISQVLLIAAIVFAVRLI